MPDKYPELTPELYAYAVEHGARQDDVLRRLADETARELEDVAIMQIGPDQGAFMTLLLRLMGARRALELGTFTGYSAICIARGLAPGGRLIACEVSEEYAETASRNLEDAGVADRVEIRIGPAADTLRDLPEREAFDFAFIDADKPGYPDYYELVLARLRSGGLVAVDNVLADGGVVDEADANMRPESLEAILRLNDQIVADDRVDVAMLGIADGLTLARKR
jgi:caffeoyl-CoA O-methyltransferase